MSSYEDLIVGKVTVTKHLVLQNDALITGLENGDPSVLSGAHANGVTDDRDIIQNFLNANAGKRVRIPAGRYYIDITGDESTIVIPGNTWIDCDPGAVFYYDFFGSPVFAVLGTTGNGVKFTGYTFEFGGTYSTDSKYMGTKTFLTFNRINFWHRFSADIVCMGASRCTFIGRHTSTTTANANNVGIYLEGADDGVTNAKNNYLNLDTDGRCQGAVVSAQTGPVIYIRQGSLPGDSQNLYGGAHAMYNVIERQSNHFYYDLVDTGEYVDSLNLTETHTLALKNAAHGKVSIISSRSAGALGFAQLNNVDAFINFTYSGTVNNASVGHIFYSGQGGPTDSVSIKGSIVLTGAAHSSVAYSSFTGATQNAITNTRIDLYCQRNCSGSESQFIRLGETNAEVNLVVNQTNGTNRAVVDFSGSNCVARVYAITGGYRYTKTSPVGTGNRFIMRSRTLENVLYQNAIPMVIPPSGYMANNGVLTLGTNPAGSLSFGANTGSGVTLTGTSTSFAATDVGRVITCDSGKQAAITAYTSATSVTVTITGTLTTTSFANNTWWLANPLATTYSSAFMYLPANAISTGSAAGHYYAVMTTTTSGTVYNNLYTSGKPAIPTPTAFVTTGPGAFTQTTAEITFFSDTISGNSLNTDGFLGGDVEYTANNNAGVKTANVKFGGSIINTTALASLALVPPTRFHMKNRGATNKQVTTSPAGTRTYTTVDATIDKALIITLQLASANDTITIESYKFELINNGNV